MQSRSTRRIAIVLVLVSVLSSWSAAAAGAADHLHGVIAGRSDDGMLIVQTDESTTIFVVLVDATKIRQVSGMRTTRMSSASLIPGLRVVVSGRYDAENRVIADRVTFSKSHFKTARAIEAGVAPLQNKGVGK
jgi:hypothetical protein